MLGRLHTKVFKFCVQVQPSPTAVCRISAPGGTLRVTTTLLASAFPLFVACKVYVTVSPGLARSGSRVKRTPDRSPSGGVSCRHRGTVVQQIGIAKLHGAGLPGHSARILRAIARRWGNRLDQDGRCRACGQLGAQTRERETILNAAPARTGHKRGHNAAWRQAERDAGRLCRVGAQVIELKGYVVSAPGLTGWDSY